MVYVPSTNWAMDEMLTLARIKKGEKAIDLGSGNGKVVIALAERGAKAHGIELNPFLLILSYWNIKKAGVAASVQFGNIFHTDLSSYDVITLYVVPVVMKRLEKKLRQELKPGARLVTETFVFPNWKPTQKNGSVYLYTK